MATSIMDLPYNDMPITCLGHTIHSQCGNHCHFATAATMCSRPGQVFLNLFSLSDTDGETTVFC